MDGFVAAYRVGRGLGGLPDPIGYYDARDVPLAWNLADRYVLFDRFFSSARGGSAWNHMFADQRDAGQPEADGIPPGGFPDTPTIFDRLQAAGVSWRYYVKSYDPTNTIDNPAGGDRASQLLQVPPLAMPRFVRSPKLMSHIVDLQRVLRRRAGRAAAGRLVHRARRQQRAPAGQADRRADARSHDRQRAHAQPGVEEHRLRAHVRQLGRLVRPRAAALRRSSTATASACRRCSSAPTPSRGRSTMRHWISRPSCASSRTTGASRRCPAATRSAQSIASAFDFGAPPRAPELVSPSRTPEQVATVHTRVVFWAYGGAVALAGVLISAAFGLTRRGLRRRARVTP